MQMRITARRAIPMALGLTLAAGGAHAAVNLPLGGGLGGVDGLKLVPAGGVKAQVRPVADAGGTPGIEISFAKAGEERRFLALEARPKGDASGAKALAMRLRLKLAKGSGPRPAVVVYDSDGGAWCKTGGVMEATGEAADLRLPIAGLRQAGFSEDKTGQLEWGQISKVWVGLVLDGDAEGTLTLTQPRLTDEAYHPDRPAAVTGGDNPGKWSVGKDPAVQATLTTPNEGPDGKPCMKFDFRFPGGRHMYALPSVALPGLDLEGYRALRFSCKATLPPGIKVLLVTLAESQGGQYFAEPEPPANGEWGTVEVPMDSFRLASWSKDPDGKLDRSAVGSIIIGTHGASAGEGGPGTICIADVQFVP